MSRGFACALFGIAMTLFSWFGPWEWPAWPAFTTLDVLFGDRTSWAELPTAARGAVLVALIVVNSGFWGGVAALAFATVRKARTARQH